VRPHDTAVRLWLLVGLSLAARASAQEGPRLTALPHPDDVPYWVSGQLNVIYQGQPGFPAAYSGTNSLHPYAENAVSYVATLYTGIALSSTTELFLDAESAGGRGISYALGLAGFTNLDVVRNPSLSSAPYLARLMVRQIFPLTDEMVPEIRGPLDLATRVAAKRIELRAGRFSLVDFFDLNDVGSDSHLGFLNWTVDNNGAYDYAADTRGYSWGFILEYQEPAFGIRYGMMMMPKVANGIDLDADLLRASGNNLEAEFRYRLGDNPGLVRLLTYVNIGNMGDYQQAIDDFQKGQTPLPDVVSTRQQGTVKYGFGLNLQQAAGPALNFFLRAGWNEGAHESFAYTEVNDSVALGGVIAGALWGRPQDKVGLALVSNGLSEAHRQYLAQGGLGFLLGDGKLSYGRECIAETYYTFFVGYGVFLAVDLQGIANPGYNRDRGPVFVGSFRFHADI
jgi:high affinity Mn2+ porin